MKRSFATKNWWSYFAWNTNCWFFSTVNVTNALNTFVTFQTQLCGLFRYWIIIPVLVTYFSSYYSWATIFRKLFSKRCTFGSKSGTKSLVRRYPAKFRKTVPEHLKVCHIWLINSKKKLCLVIFFSHIIQITLFSSEYSPFYLL